MKQGLGTAGAPPTSPSLSLGRRARLSAIRRAKYRLLPGGMRFRTLPLGIGRGIKVKSDLHEPAYLWLGLYEYEIQCWLRKFAQRDGVVYDVGAASGVLSLAFARRTSRTVFCFEPDAGARTALAEHVRWNPSLGSLIEVSDRAVGARGEGNLSLDRFAQEHPRPTLIKIDVEGAEMEVLMGASGLLRDHSPHVVVETHSAGLENACAEFLIDLGYAPIIVSRRRRLREDRPSLHNRWIVAEGARVTGHGLQQGGRPVTD